MTKNRSILLALTLIILGWISNALAWIVLDTLFNTIGLVMGIGAFLIGIIWLIIILILHARGQWKDP